jgi:flagellar biosynthesis/type III secretory pathway chaperone
MPLNKQTLHDLFETLEAILVNTFRLCESLQLVSKKERQALLAGKTEILETIAKEKGNIISEMEGNEETRMGVVQQIAQVLEIKDENVTINSLVNKAGNSIDTSKISRLLQGIITLQAEIRELNNGNYALATLNVQRLEAIQEYIVGLFTPPVYYRPTINVPVTEAPASWGHDRLA